MTININIETGFLWSKYRVGTTNIYIKGYIYSHTINDILNHVSVLKKDDVESFLNSLDALIFLLLFLCNTSSSPLFI